MNCSYGRCGSTVIRMCAACVVLAAVLAGCGSGGDNAETTDSVARGNVSVMYAGSLENVMDKSVGPAFERATGYGFAGYPAGSTDLANEIKSKVRRGDVFISASPSVNATLTGARNGSWVSWYAPFATTRLVLGYNPHSSFASQLRTRPWYRVITEPGFRLGFTDPTLDPKGVLTVAALRRTATLRSDPALRTVAADQGDLFPEQDLVGRLEAGQLDAGFFYTVEARAAGIPTVELTPVSEHAEYTVTVLNHGPNPAGAAAFVHFLLGAQGRTLLRSAGLTTIPVKVVGSGVPSALDTSLNAGR